MSKNGKTIMDRWLKILLLFFICIPCYPQNVIRITKGYILIDRKDGIGQIGELIPIKRHTDDGTLDVGIVKLIEFRDGKAAAKVFDVFLASGVQVGDFVEIKENASQNELPLSEADATPSDQVSADLGPPVSNVFFETDLRQALRDLSEESQIPILPDNTVQGLVSIEFSEVPLETILTKILAPFGYTYKKMDDYYIVGSLQPDNPAFPILTETEYYSPDYLLAEQIPKLLPDFYTPFVKVNERTNSIAITATNEIINKIKGMIKELDVYPVQISIESIVVELSSEAKKSIGIDWEWLGESDGKNLSISSNLNTALQDTSLSATLIKTGINYKNFTYDVLYSLRALASSGDAKIKANPKISTINGQEASIFIGIERYFSIVSGPVNYPYARVEKIPVGITLRITPWVSSKNEITVKIDSEVSEVSAIGASGLPMVTKRQAQTNVCVKNGDVIAIGGLVQEFEIENRKKIPLLGSIPLLGYLFSHTTTEKIQKEINIFISPHVLTGF